MSLINRIIAAWHGFKNPEYVAEGKVVIENMKIITFAYSYAGFYIVTPIYHGDSIYPKYEIPTQEQRFSIQKILGRRF